MALNLKAGLLNSVTDWFRDVHVACDCCQCNHQTVTLNSTRWMDPVTRYCRTDTRLAAIAVRTRLSLPRLSLPSAMKRRAGPVSTVSMTTIDGWPWTAWNVLYKRTNVTLLHKRYNKSLARIVPFIVTLHNKSQTLIVPFVVEGHICMQALGYMIFVHRWTAWTWLPFRPNWKGNHCHTWPGGWESWGCGLWWYGRRWWPELPGRRNTPGWGGCRHQYPLSTLYLSI